MKQLWRFLCVAFCRLARLRPFAEEQVTSVADHERVMAGELEARV
jgi:hypothetical protein